MVLATYDDDFDNTMVESTKKFSGWGNGYGDSEPKAVALQNYPMFVTFTDINDARSVRQVESSNLAETFGDGYVLKTITVQLTDQPITKGIERRLPWLSKHRNESFAGNRYSQTNTLVDSLYLGSFTTEL